MDVDVEEAKNKMQKEIAELRDKLQLLEQTKMQLLQEMIKKTGILEYLNGLEKKDDAS